MTRSSIASATIALFSPAFTLGLALLLGALWAGAWTIQGHLMEQARAVMAEEARRLTEAFEHEVGQQLHSVDKLLIMTRLALHQGNGAPTLNTLTRILGGSGEPVFQLAVIGPDGILQQSNLPGEPALLDLSDRPHFRIHKSQTEDVLYVSRPLVGRVSGTLSLQLTRRIFTTDGGFGGVVVASVKSDNLTRQFVRHEKQGGHFLLIGYDGVLRSSLPSMADAAPSYPTILAASEDAALGDTSFYSRGKHYFGAFRLVSGAPLIAVAGFEKAALVRQAAPRQWEVTLAALLLSFAITAVAVLLRQRQMRLVASRQALRKSTQALRLSLDVHGVGNFQLDFVRRRLETGGGMRELFALTASTLGSSFLAEPPLRAWLRRIPREERRKLWSALRRVLRERRQDLDVALALSEAAGGRQISLRARLAYGLADEPLSLAGIILDVTEMQQAEARIAYLAHYDPLTHLPNRLRLRESLEELLSSPPAGGFAVLCLDLDRFKDVNDTLGHSVGDRLLCAVVDRMRQSLRETDMLARLGGDEFCLILRQAGTREEASAQAQTLIRLVSRPYTIDGQGIGIGLSIGVVMAPEDGQDVDALLKSADLALYSAKRDGRGRFAFHGAEMDAAAQARRALETDLHRALTQGEFRLVYQPIVAAGSGRVTGMEALLRWTHPRLGMVPPDRFIPIAEEIGLILPIGEWVLREACREAARWPEPVKIAVNLSALQLEDQHLVAKVKESLRRSGLNPGRLELEVTETAMLRDPQAALGVMLRLKALGAAIVMDDFGAGYSSLGYLQSFPFDKVKIDRSFVSRDGCRRKSNAIVSAISAICQGLQIISTAEGVETPQQLEEVRQRGIAQVQGYLFSRPVPPQEVEALFHRLGVEAEAARPEPPPAGGPEGGPAAGIQEGGPAAGGGLAQVRRYGAAPRD